MRWAHLLFAHWRVPPEVMAPLLPRDLELETFDGAAWIGLVPFRMEAVHVRGVPSVAERALRLDHFLECNVRTYARCGDVSGVWFFSLDAERLLPVLGGRWMWGLNYVHSRMSMRVDGDRTTYTARRRDGTSSRIVWRTGASLPPSRPGTLEDFLTNRLELFSVRGGRVYAGRVDHAPWPLREASIEVIDDGLVAAAGVHASGAPHLLASDGVDTVGFPLRQVSPRHPAP